MPEDVPNAKIKVRRYARYIDNEKSVRRSGRYNGIMHDSLNARKGVGLCEHATKGCQARKDVRKNATDH